MGKTYEYGNKKITAIVKEPAYKKLIEARNQAESVKRDKNPDMGKMYSWGAFVYDLYIFAVKNGFFCGGRK